MPSPAALARRRQFERAALALAEQTGSQVRGVRFEAPISGAEYRRGLILIGADVTDLCDRYLVRGRNREVWWDLARLIGHEVAHGVAPRSSNALEEAVAETRGRRHARRVLALLEGAPKAPPTAHWGSAGMYQEQVRWLECLAAWIGRPAWSVADALKDGRRDRSRSAMERQELLLGRLVGSRLACTTLAPADATALGWAVARSAGAVNVAGRRPLAPRSPVAAIAEHLEESPLG